MKYYFLTRHTVTVAVISLVVNALLLLINRAYHYNSEIGFTLPVPLQIVSVWVLSLGLTGRTEQFEFAGARSLKLMRLFNASLLFAVGLIGAFGITWVTALRGIDTASVGDFAVVRAFIGLFGVTLGVVAFTDMRLGAVCAVPLILLPIAFRAKRDLVLSTLGFVFADGDNTLAWVTTAVFGVCGLAVYCWCYSERNSPSTSRRALNASRRGRKRKSVSGE